VLLLLLLLLLLNRSIRHPGDHRYRYGYPAAVLFYYICHCILVVSKIGSGRRAGIGRSVTNVPYTGECEQNDGVTDESTAECTVRHERRLDVFLDERQPRNIRVLNTPHHIISPSHDVPTIR